MKQLVLLSLLSAFLFVSCDNGQVLVPKPRMFPKVNYPVKSYTSFDINTCPFKMDIPKYFQYIKDTTVIDYPTNKNVDVSCWFDLYSKELNAYMHISYFDIQKSIGFDKLVGDAFEMADKHNVKANYRDEIKIDDPSRSLHGIIFEIDGPVATPLQFFVTDSTEHFLRGSLYFKSKVNRDSIAPVYNFLKEDITRLLESFKWN